MPDNPNNFFPVPTVGVAGVIFNNQKQVLLIQRNQAPAMGLWSIPGGKLEAGESMREACRREIKEETGLDTEIKSIVAVVERRVEAFHYVIVDYLALLVDQEPINPVAQSDVSEAAWICLDKLADYDLVPGLEEIIKRSYRLYVGNYTAGLYDIALTGTDYILAQ
jgi:8-oxo-dGTP diphosphatase